MSTEKTKNIEERGRINEEAAAWALRIRSGETDATGEDYLEWLAASPEHEAAMARARETWALFGDQATAPEVVKARRDALARAGRVSAGRWRGLAGLSMLFDSPIRWAAAAFLIALVAVPLLLWRSAIEDAGLSGPSVAAYATDIAETRVVTLSDNSRVSLDAASAINVNYTDEARDIALLRGQAHFDVAKNPARPFRVTAGEQTVVATGTSFNVELIGDEVLVTLIEGEVVVVDKGAVGSARAENSPETARPVTLKPGEQLVAASAAPPEIAKADIEKTSAWRHGKVMLDGDNLDMAVQRMNRYSRIRLEVGDLRLNAYRITGVFNAGDTDAFVEAVETYFPVEARRMSASSIVFYPRR